MPVKNTESRLEAETILNEMRRLAAKPRMTTEERKKFDELEAQHAIVSGAYNRSRRALLAKRLDESNIPRSPFDDAEAMAKYRGYLLTGKSENIRMGTDGTYIVPSKIWPTFASMLKGADEVFNPDVVTWLETETGGEIPVPMLDDTAINAQKIDENNITPTYSDVVFDQLHLGRAPSWRSGWVAVPRQLAQDSAYPLDFLLNEVFAARIARGVGPDLVSTIITAAASGGTATGSSGNTGGAETGATSIGTDDLETLFGSVDQAYSSSPKAGWLMRLATYVKLLSVKDKQGRPVIRPERDEQGRYLLLTRPVYFSPSVPALATGNKSVLFGDLSKVVVRAVKDGYSVLRSQERLAEFLQFGYQSFLRINYGLLRQSGSDSPIKYLQNA